MNLSHMVRTVAVSCAVLLGAPTFAQDAFPSKPIRLIVPIAAGGISDIQARVMAEEMRKTLGQPVVVENKPGGNFSIGMQALTSSPPDGYTMGWLFPPALVVNPILYKDLPYKVSDVQYLTLVSGGHQIVAVPANSPFNKMADLVQAAKRSAGPTNVGVTAIGASTHLMFEQLGVIEGFKVQPVLYRGEAPAVQDLVAGNLPLFVGVVPSVIQHYKTGKIKILAISSEKRIPELPDVPTLVEQGYKDMVVRYWAGLGVPAGTPKAVAEKLRDAAVKAMNTDAFTSRIAPFPDVRVMAGTSEEFAATVKAETDLWGKVIRERNIKPE